MKMTLEQQMTLADKFKLVTDHNWRAVHYVYTPSINSIDDYGLVMVEQLAGKYQVCRIERFYTPAQILFGDRVAESVDYQPRYYGEFTHNQLSKAFQLAAKIAATQITTNTIEVSENA